ncbi:MAG: carbohydrate-binding domain-containing protein [Synergistaceae bacterium]|nr:carbohydrate-binding domain-containing protein [Synergistaceae bacterium]
MILPLITVTTVDGGFTDSCVVTVATVEPMPGLTLDRDEMIMGVSEVEELIAGYDGKYYKVNKTLTVSDPNGPAISADGDIFINSGTVKASVTGTGNTNPAIKAGGDLTITGNANVAAEGFGANSGGTKSGGKTTLSTSGNMDVTSSGSADAVNAAGGVEITGGTNTIEAGGTGYVIDGNGAITITGGYTEITSADPDKAANPYPPEMSGADTVVIVNGVTIFGGTNPNPNNGDSGGGGCDAGTGGASLLALALLTLSGVEGKRKEK